MESPPAGAIASVEPTRARLFFVCFAIDPPACRTRVCLSGRRRERAIEKVARSMRGTVAAIAAIMRPQILFALTALSLLPATAFADDDLDRKLSSAFDPKGLQPNDLARRASTTSPTIAAREADLVAAHASVRQTELDFVPRISTYLRYTRLSELTPPSLGTIVVAPNAMPGPIAPGTQLVAQPLAFPVLLNSASAQAQLSVPVSDYLLRLVQKYDAAKKNEEAAQMQKTAARLNVETNAKLAYYEWARARLSLVVVEQNLEQSKQRRKDAKALFDTGAASNADVLRAESLVAQNESLLIRAQCIVAQTEDRLRTMAHDPSLVLGGVGEDVRTDPPAIPAGDADALLREAERQRPELLALDHTELSLNKEASALRASWFPRLDAVAEVTVANPNQRIVPSRDEFNATWSMGLVISWSPNDTFSSANGVAQLHAKADSVHEQRIALADDLRGEIVQSLQLHRQAIASLEAARRGLAASEESYRVRTALFQTGKASGTELTDAETDLLRARLALIDSLIDARIARVRLLHAVGRDA